MCTVPQLGFDIDSTACCCEGTADLEVLFRHYEVEEIALLKELRAEYGLVGGTDADGLPGPEQPKGDSGYIHPDAWPSPENIGELTDPSSTGRKRQARMYPIQRGEVCEWAGKLVKLDDLPVIIGCVNSPASDLHHGPDKNTLNNEKVTEVSEQHPLGIGTHENTHKICSDCHNSAHAKHNAFYPEYDRVLEQVKPWVPRGLTLADQYVLEDAPADLLYEEETRRAADRARRGKTGRGRKARTPVKGDLSVQDD